MSKTLTENVRKLFVEKFEELGIDYTGLKIGSFEEVGVECKIPTTLVFKDITITSDLLDSITTAYFDILDILEVKDCYNDKFDFFYLTTNEDVYNREDMEEF